MRPQPTNPMGVPPRPYPHPAALAPAALQVQCEVRHLRRSGPGGQHRNKVETAVQLVHRPTGLVAEANERRAQGENLAVALRRLRIELALEIRQPLEPDEVPSACWRSRCRAGRIAINPAHEDFPALLAEALDVLSAYECQTQPAAAVLDVTASQLVHLMEHEPRALALVNRWRAARQLRPLR